MASENPLHRFALVITYGLNPLLMPVLALTLIAWHISHDPAQTFWTFAIGGMGFVLMPGFYLAHLVKTGRVSSMEVRSREDRTGPMLVGMAGLGLVLAGLYFVVDLPLLTWLTVFQIGTGVVVMLITHFWKISIHQIGITGPFVLFAGLEVFPLPITLLLGAVMIGAVGWARVYLNAHTLAQVFGGTVLGILAATFTLWGLHTVLFLI